MLHAQADLKATLSASVFAGETRKAIDKARLSGRQVDLDRAAALMNSPAFDGLPGHEQTHIATLYSVAYLAVTGGLR